MFGQKTAPAPIDILIRLALQTGRSHSLRRSIRVNRALSRIRIIQWGSCLNGQGDHLMMRGAVIDMNDEWRQSLVSLRHD